MLMIYIEVDKFFKLFGIYIFEDLIWVMYCEYVRGCMIFVVEGMLCIGKRYCDCLLFFN